MNTLTALAPIPPVAGLASLRALRPNRRHSVQASAPRTGTHAGAARPQPRVGAAAGATAAGTATARAASAPLVPATSRALAAPAAPASAAGELPFAREVLAGLGAAHKRIHGQWLHGDAQGQRLFEAVARTASFYLPRVEQQIMAACAREIAQLAGPAATLVEAGAGASGCTLLAALEQPARHLRITTPMPALPAKAQALGRRAAPGRCVIYLPAVVSGRCSADELVALLAHLHQSAGPQALLVLGADATLDPDRLLPAYDDAGGASAAFNMSLLARINRELAANIDPVSFRHAARFDTRQRRMEMHLVSRRDQQLEVAGQRFAFMQGESIVTEVAHKPSTLRLRSLAWHAGWSPSQLWGDAQGGVAVHVFAARESRAASAGEPAPGATS